VGRLKTVFRPSDERMFVIEADVEGVGFTSGPEFKLGGLYFYRVGRARLRRVNPKRSSKGASLYRANLALLNARWDEAIAAAQVRLFQRVEILLSYAEGHHVSFRNVHLYGQKFDFHLDPPRREGAHTSTAPRVKPNQTIPFVHLALERLESMEVQTAELLLGAVEWASEPMFTEHAASETRFLNLWVAFEHLAALGEKVRATGIIPEEEWNQFRDRVSELVGTSNWGEPTRRLILNRLHQLKAPTVSERLAVLNTAAGSPLAESALGEIAAYRNGLQHEPWNFPVQPSALLSNFEELTSASIMVTLGLNPAEYLHRVASQA
jgi:hypothetical protein